MKGGYWCDLDLINVKMLDFKGDYVFVSEPTPDYCSQVPTTCLIKMPKGCRAAKRAIELCYEYKDDVLNKTLIQAVLFQKTKRYKKSRFTLSIHHSIIDGYSLGILAKELETLYNRYVGQENGENLREIQKIEIKF